MNDRVIGTSLGAQNKVGRVIGVVGDGGKRKFTIALDSGGEIVLAKRSFKTISGNASSNMFVNTRAASQAPNSVAIVEERNTEDNDRNNGENDADLSSESDQDDE